MHKVIVISDLHLGGRPDVMSDDGHISVPGFQICNAYADLIAFIDWAGSGAAAIDDTERSATLEIVINGDIVDFLAADELGADAWTRNEGTAISKFDKIVERTTLDGDGVFQALARFVQRGHQLTLLLGNHDVELALPKVRRRLVEVLGGHSDRLRIIYDGEAYARGPLLVEHGNRYDRWNMINHSALRQERAMLSRSLPIDEAQRHERYFVPPAGTLLVVNFMNQLKARYRFIDLLKPETSAVLPLLLALEPKRRLTLRDVLDAVPLGRRWKVAGLAEPTLPKNPGDMAAGELRAEHPTLDDVLRETLGEDAELFALPGNHRADMGPGDWFRSAWERLKSSVEFFAQTKESLSAFAAARRAGQAVDEERRLQQVHVALQRLNKDDTSFVLDVEDPEYLDAAKTTALAGKFEVVVYGHTHLPKSVSLAEGRTYYNSGTWADVMRLPATVHGEFEAAREPLDEFLTAIETNNFARYVKRYLTYIEVVIDGETVRRSGLASWCGLDQPREPPLTSAVRA